MKLVKDFAKAIAYLVLFSVLCYVNFYICAFAAALFFPSISDTTFAIFYALCVPMLISIVEVWLLCKKLSRKRKCKPVAKFGSTNSTSTFKPVEPVIEPILPTRYNSPVQGNIRQPSKSKYSVKEGNVETELEIIDQMDGQEFEYWCAGLLRSSGFRNVSVTQASGDHGVDILAEKGHSRYAIQCKRYSKDLGSKPVQEVVAGKAMPQYHCQFGAVITNRHFTKGATELAEANGVYLWDRDWITARLKDKQFTQDQALYSPEHNHRESRNATDKLYHFAHLAQWQAAANDRDPIIKPPHDDTLFFQAVEVVLDTRQASVSMLQRKLNLGYARAAQIMDEMETRGIVSPFDGAKPRSILITREQWEDMHSR